MASIAKFFLNNHKFTLVLSLFVIVFGISGVAQLNSESFPSVNIGAAVIYTRYDGATAEDIETKITRPIEEEIQKVSGLKTVKSISQAGLSTIITEVDIDRFKVEKVIADLQRAVDRTSGLPADLLNKPSFVEIKSDEFPILEVAVMGSNENRLRDSVADQLRDDIKDNKKVSSAFFTGFRERQFNILLDRQALLQRHVALNEVQGALARRNITIPGGELKNSLSQRLLRIEGKAQSADDLKSIVIRSNFSGQRILLGDIARIEDGSGDPVTLANIDGKPATLLTITKKGGADLLALVKEVESTLESYRDKYKGQLEFVVFNNEGLRVGDRLSVLISNGWQGMLLVFFFLLLFLPGKVGIMAALSLPLALFTTLGFIMVAGYTLNTITIIALVIAIGMLVDNSVVIAENFTRLKDEGSKTDEALITTIRDLWAPVTATVLTTAAAFLPMLVTKGVMGEFIKAIPIVVSLALLLSLAESFFLLPARLKLVRYAGKKENLEAKPGWFEMKIVPAFAGQVRWLVKNRKLAAVLFTLTMASTFSLLIFGNKFDLFPADQTEIYIGRIETKKGTRLEKTDQVAAEITASIKEAVGSKAKYTVTTAGTSGLDESDPKRADGSNQGLIRIFVTRETQDTVKTKAFLDLLRKVKHPEVERISFEALVNGPPVGAPLSVTFRSNNEKQLQAVSERILARLNKTPGILDARIDDVVGDDEVIVKVDHEKAARLGLNLQEIGGTIRTAVAGLKLGDVNLNNREVDYNLRFAPEDRENIESLGALLVADPSGNLIPLRNFSSFHERSGSPQIKRYEFRRAKTINANIDETQITSPMANSIAEREFKSIAEEFKDVSLVFGGEQEKTNESIASLFSALVLSLIGIFALLVLLFRSFLSPIIILTTVPMGLVGVSFAFFFQGIPLSFMALIGVIGLGGIIVNSGIILISFVEQLRSESESKLEDVLVQAASLRLKSVVVSSLTTISGLIPTAYGIGGVDYFIIPMAMALAWGLTTGTILTLYWVPPAYALVNDMKTSAAKLRERFGLFTRA
jgi:multidrug efflux pump subunit AcrB